MLDLVLAVAHHVLIFGLFGVLFAEFILVRPGLDQTSLRRVAATDLWYGILAGLIIAVGFSRAVFAAKDGIAVAPNDVGYDISRGASGADCELSIYGSISRLSMSRVVPRMPAASTMSAAPAVGSSKLSRRRIAT